MSKGTGENFGVAEAQTDYKVLVNPNRLEPNGVEDLPTKPISITLQSSERDGGRTDEKSGSHPSRTAFKKGKRVGTRDRSVWHVEVGGRSRKVEGHAGDWWRKGSEGGEAGPWAKGGRGKRSENYETASGLSPRPTD